MRPWSGSCVLLLTLGGCASDARSEDLGSGDPASSLPGPTPTGTAGLDGTGATDSEAGDDAMRLDLGSAQGADCPPGEACPNACVPYTHTPCDDGTSDPFAAMGLGCPGAAEMNMNLSTQGSPEAIGVRNGFGPTDTWLPREGSSFAVIGSGQVDQLDNETPLFDANSGPRYCNSALNELNPGSTLPPPIQVNDVPGDCATDEGLVGTGDCSRTIENQFGQGSGAYDYAELRIEAVVPPGNNSLRYDFAFFSTEYPFFFGREYNDMYIGWLESESWTGNISFDENGNPITLNAGFFDFRDNGASPLPEFTGTCMKQHGGTKWLTTTAPVVPGEPITLVLAVFDMADAKLDSYVFVDNFQWGCDGTDAPQTTPVG